MLDLNVTFLIQLINLVVTLVLVNLLLVRPVRDIIAKRKAGRDDLRQRIDSFLSRAAHDADTYEKTLRAAREEGSDLRRRAREEGVDQQGALLAAAGLEAADLMRQERDRVQAESDQAGNALAARVDELADDVMRKLLA